MQNMREIISSHNKRALNSKNAKENLEKFAFPWIKISIHAKFSACKS